MSFTLRVSSKVAEQKALNIHKLEPLLNSSAFQAVRRREKDLQRTVEIFFQSHLELNKHALYFAR